MARTQRPITLDITTARIAAFNEAQGGGVDVRKSGAGYSLYREDTGEPIARLCRIGLGDQFAVSWWSSRDRWEPVEGHVETALSLDDALELIASDPDGCFWH